VCDIRLDGHADGLAAQRLADVAPDLAPRDGGLQAQVTGRGDGRDELAADGAEGAGYADGEGRGGDGTAQYRGRRTAGLSMSAKISSP
jgi:hypothetical protein